MVTINFKNYLRHIWNSEMVPVIFSCFMERCISEKQSLRLQGMCGDCLVQSLSSKTEYIEQVTQDCIQFGCKYIPARTLYNLSGKPVWPTVLKQFFFFNIWMKFCVFQVLSMCIVLWARLRKVWLLVLFYPPFCLLT